ncbi:MAG: hypothetical protein JNK93_18570 [Planctomycetia bacterium]|nr:hypothetical protein [Planctomycetia bacterium]
MPRYAARRFFASAGRQIGEGEIESEANLAFFKAIRFYKPEYRTAEGKPVQFNTYAIKCITRTVGRFVSRAIERKNRMPTLAIFVGRGRGMHGYCPPGTVPTDAIAIDYQDIESAHDARVEIAERLSKLKPVHREIFLDWLGGFLDANGNERPQLSFVKLAAKYRFHPVRIAEIIRLAHEQLGIQSIDRSLFARPSRAPVSPSSPSAA